MECPCSTYCVTSSNNTINFQYGTGDANVTVVYTIPVGNYTASDIVAMPPYVDSNVSIKVSGYNDLQNKFIFSLTPISFNTAESGVKRFGCK